MKTIILSIMGTLTIVYLALYLFLNPILSVFGMAATTVESLNQMHAAQQTVQSMKQRHTAKKAKATKRIGKKAAKRVSASVLAAATIGTIAVATAVTAMEVSDYCDDKKELQEDGNILNGTNVEFDMEMCLDEGKEDAKAILDDVKATSTQTVKNAMENTADYSADKWNAIKQASSDAATSASDYTAELWESTKCWLDGDICASSPTNESVTVTPAEQ